MMFNDDTPETQDTMKAALEEAGAMEAPREVAVGDRVQGTVIRIGEATSFIEFGGRSEATIDSSELRNADGSPAYKEGDAIEAVVASVGEGVALTLGKGRTGPDLTFIDEAAAGGVPIEGTIKAVNKGGLVVDVGGIRAFCPVSQIDLNYVADPSAFVGRRQAFRILQWEKDKKNLVVSRRAILQEERENKAVATRARLTVGADFDGVVRRLAAFGAFIDLGGVEGLAHVSELSHARVSNPAEVLKEGDQVRVRVIKIEDLGGAKERISLSMKALAGDPWVAASRDYPEGTTVPGTIVRLTDFGAFVELAPGIDGLIHVSELAHRQVAHPRDAVQVGQKVEARVLRTDPDKKRISLSLKALEAAPAAETAAAPPVQVGQVVEGIVSSIKSFGIFVNLTALGPRVSGLIPRMETGEPRGTDLGRKYPAGSTISAEVIQIDEQGRIRLSIAGAHKHAEEANLEEYRKAQPSRSNEPALGPMAELLRPLKEKMEQGMNP